MYLFFKLSLFFIASVTAFKDGLEVVFLIYCVYLVYLVYCVCCVVLCFIVKGLDLRQVELTDMQRLALLQEYMEILSFSTLEKNPSKSFIKECLVCPLFSNYFFRFVFNIS